MVFAVRENDGKFDTKWRPKGITNRLKSRLSAPRGRILAILRGFWKRRDFDRFWSILIDQPRQIMIWRLVWTVWARNCWDETSDHHFDRFWWILIDFVDCENTILGGSGVQTIDFGVFTHRTEISLLKMNFWKSISTFLWIRTLQNFHVSTLFLKMWIRIPKNKHWYRLWAGIGWAIIAMAVGLVTSINLCLQTIIMEIPPKFQNWKRKLIQINGEIMEFRYAFLLFAASRNLRTKLSAM